MKTLRIASALAALALVTGCEKASDTASMPEEQNQIDVRNTQDLTPTSRDQQPTASDASSASADATTADANASMTVKEPDNSGVNKRDRDDATLTPGDQGKTEADREITRKIRQAIIDNDQLSFTAKNVKIITVDGQVTLRGPVGSEHEKSTIAALAQQAAGTATVDNQLEIKTTNQNQ